MHLARGETARTPGLAYHEAVEYGVATERTWSASSQSSVATVMCFAIAATNIRSTPYFLFKHLVAHPRLPQRAFRFLNIVLLLD